jgi:disulfide bond formation protein DsbB
MSRFAQKHRSQPGAAAAQFPAVESAYTALMRAQRWFVGMLIACAILGFTVLHGPPRLLGRRIFLPAIFASSLMALAFTLRNSLVLPSLGELRANPRDEGTLRRWSRNTLIVQFLCSAVGLTGFSLQLLGAPVFLALTMYVIAFAYLILLRPVRP